MSEGEAARSRPFHLIRRDRVATWLSDSVVKQVTIHMTSADGARRLRAEGARIEMSAVDTSWGRGFYSSVLPDRQYGDTAVRVAVRLRRPLVIEDALDGAALVDDLLRSASTDDVRGAVEAAGFDGVVIHFGPEDSWVVAYRDEQVKVIDDA